MGCNICLDENDELINVLGPEGFQLNIAFVLAKHFTFCFEGSEPNGCICRKCWWKIDIFHQFYVRIEELHRPLLTTEKMFVDDYGNCDSEEISTEAFTIEFPDPPKIKVCTEVDYALGIEQENGTGSEMPELDSVNNLSTEIKISVDNYAAVKYETTDVTLMTRKGNYCRTISTKRKKKSPILTSLQCDRCGQRFMTQSKLLRHIKRDHTSYPFKCTSCIESFLTQKLLDKHINQEHSKQQCPHCKKLITSTYLPQHIKLIHELQYQIICELCGKVSNTKESHNIHYKFEHMGSQKKLQCDICGQWLKHKDILRKHMFLQHVQGPQTCNICGKISPNSKALGMHKKIHSDDYKEKFKCIVCGKGFRENTKLKEHSYIHTGVTDAYQCNFCEKTFRFGSAMYAHRKKAHPNEDTYQNKKRVTT